jgi:hypothetical protein
VIRQIQTSGTLFDLPVDFRVQTVSGDFDFSERIDSAVQTASFVVGAEPTGLLVDPDDWIVDEQLLAPTSAGYTTETAAAQSLRLLAPRPNPFRAVTELRYYLPRAGEVSLTIHDVAGRTVRTLSNGLEETGSRRIFWDRRSESGSRVAPGAYWVRLAAPEGTRSQRVVVLD